MSWTSMHFAVGMGCGGALAGTACLVFRRGWRFLPLAMTAGGIFAVLPDMPRFFREDFPSLPFAGVLGLKSFERFLHRYGDLFCFHAQLDAQPKEYALAGLGIILILYNMALGLLMFLEHRQRNSVGNRAWRVHGHVLGKSSRRARRRRDCPSADPPIPDSPPPVPPDPLLMLDAEDPVIHRIGPENADQAG